MKFIFLNKEVNDAHVVVRVDLIESLHRDDGITTVRISNGQEFHVTNSVFSIIERLEEIKNEK